MRVGSSSAVVILLVDDPSSEAGTGEDDGMRGVVIKERSSRSG